MKNRNRGREVRLEFALRALAPLIGLVPFLSQAEGDPSTPIPVTPTPDAAATPAAPAPSSSTTLSEVVVTATKRQSSLRDIPKSITSFRGEDLEARNVQDSQDIVKLVPGVNYTSAGDSAPRITVRGISPQPGSGFTTGQLFGDTSFVDEYAPLVSLDPNTFDLKSVDVLKGPQGTLFGASALNGAIRYVPNGPRFGTWQTRYYVDYSKYVPGGGGASYGGVLNVPVYGDALALRLVGFERDQPGYIGNTRTGARNANRINQGGLRGILGWQPTDQLNATFTYAWQNTHAADKSVADNSGGQLTDTDSPRPSPNHQNYTLASLQLSYDFPWAQLVSDTSYVHKGGFNFFEASSRVEGIAPALVGDGSIPLVSQVYNNNSHTESEELRLVSSNPNSNWKWVTGVSLSQQHVNNRLDFVIGSSQLAVAEIPVLLDALDPGLGSLYTGDGEPDLVSTQSSVTIKEEALFGSLTWRLWHQLEITAGGRLYRTDSGGVTVLGGLLTEATKGTPEQMIVGDVRARDFNPDVSILWHATPNLTPYATAAKGFRVGGVQFGTAVAPGSNVPTLFHSDTIWNYETGIRTQWLHKTLRFDVAVFAERWKNPQYLEPDSLGLLDYITNVGGVQSKGGEAALQMLLPIKGLMISASGSYADTTTTKPFLASNGANVPVGAQWPFAPRWQTATTLSYIVDVGPINLSTAITHTYLGKGTNSLAQEAAIFGYQQWDGGFTIADKHLPWAPELAVTLDNALDARGVVNRVFNASPPAEFNDVTYIPPRSINLRLMGRF